MQSKAFEDKHKLKEKLDSDIKKRMEEQRAGTAFKSGSSKQFKDISIKELLSDDKIQKS